jgi:hypothetical protein
MKTDDSEKEQFMKQNKMLVVFSGLFFVLLLANSANSQTSPLAGKYQGTFTLKPAIIATSDEESADDGTWDISIASDGDITGSHYSKAAGDKMSFEGNIDEKGRVTIFYRDKGTTIKGLLEKTGKYLSGSLRVSCDNDSKMICAEIKVRLKRI